MLEKNHNEFWHSLDKSIIVPYPPRIEDENGYIKIQLWVLMNELGKYLTMGQQLPFDTYILIDESDLKK